MKGWKTELAWALGDLCAALLLLALSPFLVAAWAIWKIKR